MFGKLQQEGQLCAQHALNALLQGPYFTAVDLATIAQQLDEEERKSMAEGGIDSKEYQEFLAVSSTDERCTDVTLF
jgi:ataxin-3